MKCPFCLENFFVTWESFPVLKQSSNNWRYVLRYQTCPSCDQLIIELGATGPAAYAQTTYNLVRPKSPSRSPLPKDIPDEFIADYNEACLVISESPKASAALSRRCLQYLLREKAGVRRSDLSNEIQQILDSNKLPSHIADDLDAVRNIGNFAAHPIKNTSTGEIVDVEVGEAEWNLDVLESLFDYYFIQPAIAQKKRDALNAKLKAAGKPEMK